MMKPTHDSLDKHHDNYRRGSAYDDCTRRYTFRAFSQFLTNKEKTALEFGCSDGLMTQLIAEHVAHVHVVEGAAKFLNETRTRNIPNATLVHSLFEEFESPQKFDFIFATFVLTHISDVKLFFEKVRSLLKPGGMFFVAVPNSRVLSRQLALQMGLLQELMALSDNDRNHGHCRTYDRVRLNRDLKENKFITISEGGVLLKPLADFQMDKLIEHEVLKQPQLDGLYSLGREYPDLCGTLFSICIVQS